MIKAGGVEISEDELKIGSDTLAALKAKQQKTPAFQSVIARFPRAIAALALIGRDGCKKYSVPLADTSFLQVPIEDFDNALVRHQLDMVIEGPINAKDGGHLHRGHIAWNALAALEKALAEREQFTETLAVTANI